MLTPHWKLCEAPICADTRCYISQPNWKNEVLWYPGESVCQRKPFTKWQSRQSKINRWVKKYIFKYPELYFTVNTLLRGSKIYSGRKGGNPNAMTWDKLPTGRLSRSKIIAKHSPEESNPTNTLTHHPKGKTTCGKGQT